MMIFEKLALFVAALWGYLFGTPLYYQYPSLRAIGDTDGNLNLSRTLIDDATGIDFSANPITVRTGYVPRGNEYIQFLRYINFSSSINNGIFDKYYYEGAKTCIGVGDHGSFGECTQKLSNKIATEHPEIRPFWNRTWNGDRVATDCQYTIVADSLEMSHREHLISDFLGFAATFTIRQSNCFSQLAIPGGASFHISSTTDMHTNVCGVVDRFDNDYTVTCYLPFTRKRDSLCMNISAIIEYEHFDAFGIELDTNSHMFKMDTPILTDYPLCYTNRHRDKHESGPNQHHTQYTYLHPEGSVYLNDSRVQFIRSHWDFNATTKKPVWKGTNGVTSMEKSQFTTCLSNSNLELLGESHQRFTWNFVVYHYLDAQKTYLSTLEAKHGGIKFTNFTLELNYFYPSVAKAIDAIDCNSKQLPLSIAVQTGTWDLGYTSLRNVLLNPYFAQALMKSIAGLAKKPCSKSIRLVYMHVMPYPHCGEYGLCRQGRHSKTNPAIAAIDQYIEQELLKTGYPNLEIVDSLGIMKPSLIDTDCINHFLCRHGQRQQFRVHTSEAGVALAQEMVQSLCHGKY